MSRGFDAEEYIASVGWVFARTVPEHPHWYTVRPESGDEPFEQMVRHIRAHGEVKLWRPAPGAEAWPYTYLHVGEFEYWTMGAPVEETTIINRRAPQPSTRNRVSRQGDIDREPRQAESSSHASAG